MGCGCRGKNSWASSVLSSGTTRIPSNGSLYTELLKKATLTQPRNVKNSNGNIPLPVARNESIPALSNSNEPSPWDISSETQEPPKPSKPVQTYQLGKKNETHEQNRDSVHSNGAIVERIPLSNLQVTENTAVPTPSVPVVPATLKTIKTNYALGKPIGASSFKKSLFSRK